MSCAKRSKSKENRCNRILKGDPFTILGATFKNREQRLNRKQQGRDDI